MRFPRNRAANEVSMRVPVLIFLVLNLLCQHHESRAEPRDVPVVKELPKFDFRYFDSLPRNEPVDRATAYLTKKFPPGTDLSLIFSELTSAGAKCLKGNELTGERFFGCYYEKTVGIFITREWRIIIYPDPMETKVSRIVIVRDLTGL